MQQLRHHTALVCIVAACIAIAGEQHTAGAEDAADQSTSAELQLLQGTWEGVDVGDKAQQKITITITDESLHFYRDKKFWFETTIKLPAGTDPRQFHATIKDCPSPQKDSLGEVVGAIFKIEDDTLTVVAYDINEEPPQDFVSARSRYILKKTPPQKKDSEPPETK